MDKNVHGPSVSVVVPVYNEAGNIGPLAGEVIDALARHLDFELIFVDDGSTDDTAAEIRRAVTSSPFVSSRRHAQNRGQSAAVHTGVKAARSRIVAVLDGDGQNDPADIPRLLDYLDANPDIGLVIGERRNRKDDLLRKLSSRIANKVRSRLLGDGISDTGCGIKVFYREAFLELPAFDHMHRFMPALMRRNGHEIGALPVNHRSRLHGVSKYGVNNRLWVGITDMLGVMWLQKRRFQDDPS